MNGQWLKTVDGKDIYIVDYVDLLSPQYNEETAKKITEVGQKCLELTRNFMREKNIKLICNDKEF